MNKERLEVIKRRYIDYETDFNIHSEDVEWLIEQAERVQELEKTCKLLEKMRDNQVYQKELAHYYNEELEQQNKRYREALERLLKESRNYEKNTNLISFLEEALESDSDE